MRLFLKEKPRRMRQLDSQQRGHCSTRNGIVSRFDGFQRAGLRKVTIETQRCICRRACKPNSVEDDHSSRRGIAADVHQRPTRRFPLRQPKLAKGPRGRAGPARDCRRMGQPAVSLPIWSCSVWGLPCLPLYSESGALLPHLFTLTLALARAGGIFSVALAVPAP